MDPVPGKDKDCFCLDIPDEEEEVIDDEIECQENDERVQCLSSSESYTAVERYYQTMN